MFRINFKFSTAHLIMPKAIGCILAILLAIILVRRFFRCRKEGKPFFKTDKPFFYKETDKVKLIGCLILLILYPLAMKAIHFLPSSIIMIFLFNVLFCGIEKVKGCVQAVKDGLYWKNSDFKSVAISFIVAVVSSTIIWFIFGFVFKITLP